MLWPLVLSQLYIYIYNNKFIIKNNKKKAIIVELLFIILKIKE